MCRKLLITLGVLCFLCAANAKADDIAYAYCPLGEGYVFLYDSPTGFQVLVNLKCGSKLTVLDARDKERMLVRTTDGKEGYVLKSSATAVIPGGQQQTAAQPTTPPNTSGQKLQEQLQPKPQPQPQAQPQTPAQPQPPAPAQAPAQPQPPAQPKLESEPQPQPQPEAQAQTALKAEPEAEPPAQPKPEPEAELPPEPPVPPQSQPQQTKPEPKLQAEVQAQPHLEPLPPQQPAPAATAFTPLSPLGYGQNIPRLEAFVGYSFLNAGTSGLASRQNVSGLEGSVAIHVNRWIAGEANVALYYKTLQIINVGTFGFHDYVMMAGPRVNFHKAFVHALVGMDHLSGSTNFYAVNGTGTDNSLSGAVGGGVQWNVTRQFALRTSGDYVMSRFEGLTQNNFRVSVGLVFQAGSVNGRGE